MSHTADSANAGAADKHGPITRFSWGGALIALGIVFGDLGTSPLYTFKAIIGPRAIDETLVLGAVSAIFWTLTFQTTLKYVLITMRADNKGEGGIFSLYTLIRRHAKWLLWPAIIGGSFMIADSLITPPISVISAMEGLLKLKESIPILSITAGILIGLFLVQQSGASAIGKYFGPGMFVWFTMIAGLGLVNLAKDPSVLTSTGSCIWKWTTRPTPLSIRRRWWRPMKQCLFLSVLAFAWFRASICSSKKWWPTSRNATSSISKTSTRWKAAQPSPATFDSW